MASKFPSKVDLKDVKEEFCFSPSHSKIPLDIQVKREIEDPLSLSSIHHENSDVTTSEALTYCNQLDFQLLTDIKSESEIKEEEEVISFTKNEGKIQEKDVPRSHMPIAYKEKQLIISDNESHCWKNYTIENPVRCSNCGEAFSQSLSKHLKICPGASQLDCTVCRKRFSDKHSLILHTKYHADETPFKCNECGKAFPYKYRLTRHMRIHMDKEFGCEECGKTFHFKGNMIAHMRMHTGETPFTCKECGKIFPYKSSLINHMIIHRGEKSFSCHECGKTFYMKGQLKSHMIIHTGEKPYECSECREAFAHKCALKRHMNTHLKESVQ